MVFHFQLQLRRHKVARNEQDGTRNWASAENLITIFLKNELMRKPESRGSVTRLGLLASEGRPVEQDVSSLAGFIPRV